MIAACMFAAVILPVSAEGQSQWENNGTNIYYNGGNVGIGTSPSYSLEVKKAGTNPQTIAITQDSSTGILGELLWNVGGVKTGYVRQVHDGSSNYQLRFGVYFSSQGGLQTDTLNIAGHSVGIGTTSPVSRLDVSGGANVDGITVRGSSATASHWTGINFQSTGAGDNYWTAIRSINTTSNPDYVRPRIGFFTQNTNTYALGDLSERMSILAESGNVGIGTTGPGAKLTVAVPAGAPLTDFIELENTTAGGYNDWSIGTGNNDFFIKNLSNSYYGLYLQNAGTYANVGIGTTSPGARLTVAAPAGAPLTDFIELENTAAGGYNDWSIGTGNNDFFIKNLSNSYYGLYLQNAGTYANVGIGTTTPGNYRLNVNGDTNVTGNLNITKVGNGTGNIVAEGTIYAKYQDVAEWVPSSEQLAAGTVVVLDSTKSNQVTSSSVSYDTRVAGVISAQPGIALGEKSDSKVLVATTGRVKVKVDASKSPIHIGDLLVTSDVPGAAMKSEPVEFAGRKMHMPGTLIGKALEPLTTGKGEILVLLSLQ
jgi:hypothetical protein